MTSIFLRTPRPFSDSNGSWNKGQLIRVFSSIQKSISLPLRTNGRTYKHALSVVVKTNGVDLHPLNEWIGPDRRDDVKNQTEATSFTKADGPTLRHDERTPCTTDEHCVWRKNQSCSQQRYSMGPTILQVPSTRMSQAWKLLAHHAQRRNHASISPLHGKKALRSQNFYSKSFLQGKSLQSGDLRQLNTII